METRNEDPVNLFAFFAVLFLIWLEATQSIDMAKSNQSVHFFKLS